MTVGPQVVGSGFPFHGGIHHGDFRFVSLQILAGDEFGQHGIRQGNGGGGGGDDLPVHGGIGQLNAMVALEGGNLAVERGVVGVFVQEKFDDEGGSEATFEVQRLRSRAPMDAGSGLIRETIADGGGAFDEVAGGGDVEAFADFAQEDDRQGSVGEGSRGLVDGEIDPWQVGWKRGPAGMGLGFITLLYDKFFEPGGFGSGFGGGLIQRGVDPDLPQAGFGGEEFPEVGRKGRDFIRLGGKTGKGFEPPVFLQNQNPPFLFGDAFGLGCDAFGVGCYESGQGGTL